MTRRTTILEALKQCPRTARQLHVLLGGDKRNARRIISIMLRAEQIAHVGVTPNDGMGPKEVAVYGLAPSAPPAAPRKPPPPPPPPPPPSPNSVWSWRG